MKGKKLKQIISGILVTTIMLNAMGVSANATEIAVTGNTYTGSIESSFTVDDSILGGDVIVSIPAELVLEYDSTNEAFTKSDVVIAQGGISSAKKLEITVPTSIEYANAEDNSILVDGTVEFGSNGVESWSSDELSAVTEKTITANVAKDNISYIGAYRTNITYNISVVDN